MLKIFQVRLNAMIIKDWNILFYGAILSRPHSFILQVVAGNGFLRNAVKDTACLGINFVNGF
jgi:hypothetical protein